MTILFNKHQLKKRRQELRKKMPPAEIILWRYLKQSQLNKIKFRRQYSIGGYVVDFYCPKLKLAIEVDGPTHFDNEKTRKNDRFRQRYIENLGITVLRITNTDVYNNIDGVVERVAEFVGK